MDLTTLIRDIPDWPKPGIVFKDITPLLSDPAGLAMAVELMTNPFRGQGIEVVAGAESRGFIFGTAVAQALSAGFIPIRKPNKLPHDTHTIEYDLEYGTDSLEIHTDAVSKGQKVLLVDDLLATLVGPGLRPRPTSTGLQRHLSGSRSPEVEDRCYR